MALGWSARWTRTVALVGLGLAAAVSMGSGPAEARRPHGVQRHVAVRHARAVPAHQGATRVARRRLASPGTDPIGNPRFAAMVYDVKGGHVLYSHEADGLRHPASLTKVMTLYLLFEQLQAGRMTLDTEMPVSAHAAAQDPTKLGLRPGSTLRVEDAIDGIVTKSANDAAVVIAEAIGGTETHFGELMTRKARMLGMSRSFFHNASGLPDPQQITTAHDLAVLGVAIQDRFPRYFPYFSTERFVFRGRVVTGHNHLLGAVDGVDGIKTGYTRASGFNLLTSLKRDGRQLVAVVLGGTSVPQRDATMRRLIEASLPSAYAGGRRSASFAAANIDDAASDAPSLPPARPAVIAQVPAPAPVAEAPVPVPEPMPVEAPRPEPVAAEAPEPVESDIAASAVQAEPAAIPAPAPAGPTLRWQTGPAPVRSVPARLPAHGSAADTTAPASTGTVQSVQTSTIRVDTVSGTVREEAPARKAAPAPARTGWVIQVGATPNEGAARLLLDRARSAATRPLAGAEPFTETVARGRSTLYRARFGGFDGQRDAQAACTALKSRAISCMAMHL